jgi:segregation and condensation protein A
MVRFDTTPRYWPCEMQTKKGNRVTASAVHPTHSAAIEGYQLRLAMFEGPLDVLLRLIERNQLEITEVSLVEVTDQFLDYVASLPESDPGVLADFTAIASRLLVLKSRSLLPALVELQDEPETDDLRQRLIEYRAVRDAAAMLDDRQRSGQQSFRRPPSADDWGESSDSLRAMPARMLLRALERCRVRRIPEPASFRPRPIISLAEMTRRIVHRLRRSGRTRFSTLLSRRPDRHEYVAGFVTLLTLWKQRTVELWQEEHFADIDVIPAEVQEQVADD